MAVDLGAAAASGLVGGLLMTVLQIAAAAFRPTGLDLLAMWSRLLGLGAQRAVGFVIHVAVSVAVGVLYALGFSLAGASDSGWAWGLVAAIPHWLAGGLFLASVPAEDAAGGRSPGPFAMRLGAPAGVGFLAGHLLFGLAVGVTYFTLRTGSGLEAAF